MITMYVISFEIQLQFSVSLVKGVSYLKLTSTI